MNKEGHIGVVKSTEKPIVKSAFKHIADLNESIDSVKGGKRVSEVPRSRQSQVSNNFMSSGL